MSRNRKSSPCQVVNLTENTKKKKKYPKRRELYNIMKLMIIKEILIVILKENVRKLDYYQEGSKIN